MLKCLRITRPEKSFFISDPHYNHKHPEILAKAGVATVEELNEQRIRLWNEVVPDDGDVYMLGDYCLRDPDGSVTRSTLKRLKGRTIHILWGNHNSGVKKLYREKMAEQFFKDRPNDANNYEVYPLRFSIGDRKTIVFVGETLQLLWRRDGVKDHKIILSHYSHRSWLHARKGAWMLCGHSHGNDPQTASHEDAGIGKILEVTHEVIGRPLNLLQIGEIMDRKRCPLDGAPVDEADSE
jgi:calcineurin-like phosphoesterase family protein